MHHSWVSWEITLLYFFGWNCTWFGPKEPIKVQNFRLSTSNFTKFTYFDRLLFLKVYKILAQKVDTEELCLMTPKIYAKFEEKLICCFKNDRNLANFDLSTRSLKNLHCYWFLLCKIFNVWPKKVWKKFGLENDMKNIYSKFSPEHLKVSKLGLWWDLLIQSRKVWG